MTYAPRWALLVLTVAALHGCGGGSSSDEQSPSDPLRIEAVGGSTPSDSTNDTSLGSGGGGGNITVRATGAINFAGAENVPAAPSPPAAPTTGTELTNALITAGAPIAGNVLVTSALQINAGVNQATITTNSGDVVILGSLIGERSAGAATNDISIQAPSGTIYVLGSIRTAGTAGSPDNPDGGNITLTAIRVVIVGHLDARGESTTTGDGGNGGSITVDTTGGAEILYTGGSIVASGGNGKAQGGIGGDISFRAGTQVSVFNGIATEGGAATAISVTAVAGNGGNVAVSGATGADIAASIAANGGAASGYSEGAVGGDGGTISVDSAGPCRIFGSINTRGGLVSAPSPGSGSISGGMAGSVQIGLTTPPATVDMGRGTYDTSGGSGDSGGGGAGAIDVGSSDGNITVGGALIARGGTGAPTSGAGPGGSVTITTDADASGNTSNHSLTAATDIDTRAGDGFSTAAGGSVLMQCGGDLSFTGDVAASGFGEFGDGGSVSFVVDAANLAPTGTLNFHGTIQTGGPPWDGGGSSPGSGGPVLFHSVGKLTLAGDISTNGNGQYTGSGSITLESTGGDVEVTGTMSTLPGPTVSVPIMPGNVSVSAFGNIVSGAAIDVSGGSGFWGNTGSQGGDGGTVTFTSTGAGSITLLTGTIIKANGGNTYPGTSNPGGSGGRILFSTVDQAVTLTGTLTAKAGTASSAPSTPGGLGGQVVVNSDSDGNGVGGAITLTTGSVIDVSGGSGFQAGDALNNGGVAPGDSSGTNLAVVFDAAGGLTASPDGGSEGIVQNLGTIIATGGTAVARGGDIWFDGKDASGNDLGAGDGSVLIRTGSGGDGVFIPN